MTATQPYVTAVQRRSCSTGRFAAVCAALLLLPLMTASAREEVIPQGDQESTEIIRRVPTAVLPAPRITSQAPAVKTAVGYGLQRVLPQGQLPEGGFSADAELSLGESRIAVRTAGMPDTFWGSLGLRKQLLRQEIDGVDLVFDSLISLPSWSVSITPWFGCTAGMSFSRWGWYAGAQAGLFSAPMPNQRPLGPAPLISQYAGAYLRIAGGLTLHLEEGSSLSNGTVLAAVRFSAAGFTFTAAAPLGWAAAGGEPGLITLPPGISAAYEVTL